MFELMYIAGFIYKGVVEPSYKQSTRAYATCAGHISKNIGEAAPSHTHSAMIEITDKRKKRYVDLLKGESKTCLIYGPVNSSDESKVLGDFGSMYVKIRPTN